MVVFGEWAQVEAVELLNDGSGLAFGIVGGRSSGVVVKTILPGGVADRDGRLRSGDQLLRIGCVSVVGMCARQAAAVLRQCGACVRLLVARPTDAVASQSLGASPAPIVPSRLLADPPELERYLAERGHEGFGDTDDDVTDAVPEPTLIEERHLMRPVASIVAVVPRGALRAQPHTPLVVPPVITTTAPAPLRLPLDMAVRGEPETLSYSVELNKDSSLGLGITVAGYVCEQEELSGIFVKSISKSSSAYLSGKIRVNDRIVEVDGTSLNGVSNHKAVGLLRDARGSSVRLNVLRYLRGAGYERLQKALAAQDGGRRSPAAPPSPSVTSLAKNMQYLSQVDGTSLNGVSNHKAVGLLRDARGSSVRLNVLRYLRGAGYERLQKALAAQDGGRRSPAAPPSPSVTSLAKNMQYLSQVDGTSLNGVSNHKAVGLLRDARGSSVRLNVLRYLRGAGYERLQKALAAQDGGRRSPAAPPSPSVTSLAKNMQYLSQVDGTSLNGVSNHKAVGLLRDARGSSVRLKILRYLRGAGYERLQKALAAQDGGRRSPVAPPSPSVTSLAKYSFSVYEESTVIETELDSEANPHPTSPMSPSEEQEIVIGASEDSAALADARKIQDKWREILSQEADWPAHGDPTDIVVGTIMKEKDTGLGISLCGTVRVIGGREVQARHYIRAMAPHGPLAMAGLFRVGDELLEVNGWRVLGVHHVEVVSRLRSVTSPVRLVCARRLTGAPSQVIDTAQHCSAFHTRNILGGSLQNLLMPPQRLIKAKSESSVASLCSANTVISAGHDEFCQELDRNKSRSLEPLSGLAMWSDQVDYIQLQKEDRGLGFSILDYLDPSDAGRSVIVVRSVVSGGAAAADGRLAPGDRLLSVNGVDVARAPLAVAVRAIKSAPKGVVTIGVAKPLPCSSIVGGDKANGNSLSSQECINSMGSDEHTGFDSFHECLQEYQEGLEVVQICLEPEDSSIRDDEVSAFEDLSMDECRNENKSPKKQIGDKNSNILKVNLEKNETDQHNGAFVNVNGNLKSSKSDESLDDHDDDMTITEDDPEETPRDLPDKQHYVDIRSKSADRKSTNFSEDRAPLSQQQSKDISTSDEMVFAVTPTGLERINFEKYWKEETNKDEDKTSLEKIKSEESWKDCLNSPASETPSFYDATAKLSVQDSNSLLFIDHECDGYETCLDDDSNSTKAKTKELHFINEFDQKAITQINKDIASVEQLKSDDDIGAKSICKEANVNDDAVSYEHYPYVQEHIIKQMKSLRIEPLNVNITSKKFKKRSPNKSRPPTKTGHKKQHCIEYYNDQAECLEEYKRQKKLEEEERLHKEEQKKLLQSNRITLAKKLLLKKQEPSEESTDQETSYVPGCHKCFLENYAYAITKAYIAKANACKFCEVIREMLEAPKRIPERSVSAPALLDLDLVSVSETEDDDQLLVPTVKDRRKSAGPLRFLVPSRRQSYAPPPNMTVSVSAETKDEEGDVMMQRWGTARSVTLRRKSAKGSLGISIVGGKVDIISNRANDADDKGIFGIFIKNVVPDSPAGLCGELHTGDRILEVDGVCVRNAPHERAVQLIKAAGEDIVLTVQSLQAWTTDSSDVEPERVPSPTPSIKRQAPQPPRSPVATAPVTTDPAAPVHATPEHEIKITVTSEPEPEQQEEEKEAKPEPEEEAEKKTVYSDDEDSSEDEEDDRRDLEGRTCSEKGIEIDRASAGAVRRSKEEKEADREEEDEFGYTSNKIRKKYAPLGDSVVCVRLERSDKFGLGLSLAGHRDRSRMAVFVCGLNPAGAAAKAQPPVKVGDEILEVNGIVLHGRCHLNASAIIKGLAGPVFKVILLRRKQALEDVAVKPLTQFPVALEEESEDKFAGYRGVRHVSIKKGTASLGIMIIEGRHAEVGQGIFISDIQEGSAAEQAGLQIGDLILAVNKDSLLGSSYDSAASLLKRTEGVVLLTVCNPNKKEDSPTDELPPGSRPESRNQSADALRPGAAAAASRPQTPAKPQPSPAKAEPPPDPATAVIQPGKDTVIELNTQSQSPGILVVGGSDTQVTGGAVILEVYAGGVAGKDGRLQPGDQILDSNGVAITKDMTHERLCLTIKQKQNKIKMTVRRPEVVQYHEVEVELARKPGKGLGLCIMNRAPPPGSYISEILPGGPADLDGRLQKYDIISSVDGKDLFSSPHDDVAVAMKAVGPKAVVKVKRFKIVR